MAECGPLDMTCKGQAVVDTVTDGWATAMKEDVEGMIRGVFTGWINVQVPMIGDTIGPVGFLQSHLLTIAALFVAVSTVCLGIRLVFKPSREVIGSGAVFYARVLVVIGGSATIARLLITAADGYSLWIIDASTEGTGLADTLLNTLGLTGMVGAIGMLLYGSVAWFFSFIQGLLLAARALMLPVLVGASPVAVAASQSQLGEAMWQKYLSWFTAFLLYKPAAATIYATGFYLLGEGNVLGADSLGEVVVRGMNFIYGSVMMLMALLAGPALFTVITPVVGKMTGGLSGLAVVGASAASLAATGVINKGARPGNSTVGAPTSITPTNQAAGAPGGPGQSGAQGPSTPPVPGAPGTPGGSFGSITPVGAGVQAAQGAVKITQQAQEGLSRNMNPQEDR